MSHFLNKRKRSAAVMLLSLLLLAGIAAAGTWTGSERLGVDLDARNQAPSLMHLFGTDWLGRDMFARTVKGLSLSLWVGVIAAFTSSLIAFVLSVAAVWNSWMDRMVTFLIDLFLSVPHIVLLLLISFAFGGGFIGVTVGLALTHWPSLARVLRAEIMQVKHTEYTQISRRMGKPGWWIAVHHYLPHLLPQLFIGFILLFPHAVLHEAAITFLGFGLPEEQPAIGVILSESMQYLSMGMWWLAFFPGLSLLLMATAFEALGRNIRRWMDPFYGQKGS
ncbi:ABC transporter permease [Virgibacillus sediminis]|uniref:ABC transporter permease n=1 Tax=Virgibacillus sediminis TaxID=202260 RepID=A0ABV7A477_9BACI